MKRMFLSATALALALSVPTAMAAPAGDSVTEAKGARVMELAQSTTPQRSRPGPNEQGGQRTGDPGTANPPTSTTGAPPAPRTGMQPMPSTSPSAAPATDPTKSNESNTGMRAGDPGAKELPTTPGSGRQPPADATQSVTPPGPSSPGTPQPNDATGMRSGDPGTKPLQPAPSPRG